MEHVDSQAQTIPPKADSHDYFFYSALDSVFATLHTHVSHTISLCNMFCDVPMSKRQNWDCMPTSADRALIAHLGKCQSIVQWPPLVKGSLYETSKSSISRVMRIVNCGDEVSHAFWLQNTDFLTCWTMWLAPIRTWADLRYLAFISL